MPHFDSPGMMTMLLASTLVLSGVLAILLVSSTWLQWRRDRQNRHRIHCYNEWERDLPVYLFQGGKDLGSFAHLKEEDRPMARSFLARYRAAVGGDEALSLRALYQTLGLDRDLTERLAHADPKGRALAAQEIWAFSLGARLPDIVGLLEDPHPFVSLAAARTLARSRDLAYAEPVLKWVVEQDEYQQDRLMGILQTFGPQLVPWMRARLHSYVDSPAEWRLLALMAAAHRSADLLPDLLHLLKSSTEEVVVAALKALAAISNPEAFQAVAAVLKHPSVPVRIHAVRALGALGGPMAMGDLVEALADLSFEVRRTAAMSLAGIGQAGASTLEWVAKDPAADPFARDMAQAQLEWISQRGRV